MSMLSFAIVLCLLLTACGDKKDKEVDDLGTISSISVTQQPTKTEYAVGETFSPSGLEITAHMEDDTTKVLESKHYDLSSPDMSTPGTKTITVTTKSQDKTTSFTITVNPNDGGEEGGERMRFFNAQNGQSIHPRGVTSRQDHLTRNIQFQDYQNTREVNPTRQTQPTRTMNNQSNTNNSQGLNNTQNNTQNTHQNNQLGQGNHSTQNRIANTKTTRQTR